VASVGFAGGRFSNKSLAAIKEVHTPAGKHKLLITPFRQIGCQKTFCKTLVSLIKEPFSVGQLPPIGFNARSTVTFNKYIELFELWQKL
jgi:hypothetical protein